MCFRHALSVSPPVRDPAPRASTRQHSHPVAWHANDAPPQRVNAHSLTRAATDTPNARATGGTRASRAESPVPATSDCHSKAGPVSRTRFE